MTNWRSEPKSHRDDVVTAASPQPRMPTEKEKQQIADAHRRAEKERAAMRAAGFGDHKGTEGT